MQYTQVALELYTVRDETRRDFEGTLRRVAQMGYAGVEFAGYGNLSAQAMAALLAETGLRVAGTHVGLDGLSGAELDASIRYCHAIDCPAMVLPSLPQERRTLDGIRALGPQLNSIGQRCRAEGIDFGYHNHDFEFTHFEGRTLLDHLLEITDPNLVKIELDVYWAAYASHDPLALLNRLGERIILIHFKDMAPDRSMTEVGKGILDMQGMTAFARQHGLWAVVEHDHPTLPSLESAKVSLEYFH
ncbi:MAG TPA: sugar phosphate isomerase/epimerase [Ktedonobacteraceae bacterium]|nr:sugar phosphate isomerase/epimerase [Ktedonobacteraceae bacterium]